MLSQKNLRVIQVIILVLVSTTLISLYQNLQANRHHLEQLHDIQQRLDALDLEIMKIQDQINETVTKRARDSSSRPPIVIRIDDMGNFAVDAQIEILEFHLANEIPVSLGIIPSFLGSDEGLIDLLGRAAQRGLEICAHGWEHENFTELGLAEQIVRMNQSRILLREMFDLDVDVFIPPYYECNSDTISAMKETGFSIISADKSRAGLGEEIFNYPATVSFSQFSGEMWVPRSPEFLILKLMENVERYGYAVIITHPQEFLRDGEVDPLLLSGYRDFIQMLEKTYYLTTFSELGS
jgi:predicted deacetylase